MQIAYVQRNILLQKIALDNVEKYIFWPLYERLRYSNTLLENSVWVVVEKKKSFSK